MARTPLPLSFAVLLMASGCEVLTSTQLPASYSTAGLYVLAGATGGDDVWIRHETSKAPIFFHFDGQAWAEVPSEALKAAAGDLPTVVATATAARGCPTAPSPCCCLSTERCRWGSCRSESRQFTSR